MYIDGTLFISCSLIGVGLFFWLGLNTKDIIKFKSFFKEMKKRNNNINMKVEVNSAEIYNLRERVLEICERFKKKTPPKKGN